MQAITATLFIALFTGLTATVSAQTLPEGEGRESVANICSQCHELRLVTDTPRTREQWQYIVSMMISLGAPVPGDEVDIIVAYLARNFGKPPAPPENASGER